MHIALTRNETWYLWRRRQNLSGQAAAEKWGVGVGMVWQWDHFRTDNIPDVALDSPPTPGETATILRRRANIALKDAAQIMQVSRPTIIGWEKDKGEGIEAYIEFLLTQQPKN